MNEEYKVKNENAVKAGKASAATRKAKQDALISELDWLKEINLAPVESAASLQEIITTSHHSPIESYAVRSILVLSVILVVVAGIYLHLRSQYQEKQQLTPLTTVVPMVASLPTLAISTQKVKDERAI